jgi:TATA-box binding protein (TBP) (component of TFIID and TFIIIB)
MSLSSKTNNNIKAKTNTKVNTNVNTKANVDVDDEWSSFITGACDDDSDDVECNINYDMLAKYDTKNDITTKDDTTKDITTEITTTETTTKNSIINGLKTKEIELTTDIQIPEPSEIYISTKSKIAYLTDAIDLKIFWDIPVIPYATATNGVIKKQIKFNSKTPEELNDIQERIQKELYYEEHIMSHIDNPNGRVKFKDIRKITIGISKKDIMSYRSKKKQAFYNCFVMIIRLKVEGLFREFHIKVFNTGKMEIPGVQNDDMFELVLKNIVEILQPYTEKELSYKKTSDTVLINSNFNCGFYIDRERLYDILKYKYNIHAIYDPCSYPGIQSKFYYNNDIGIQTGIQINSENKDKYKNITEVSFMIFRTGSVLIVGMCEENVLFEIYEFLKVLFKAEFNEIYQGLIDIESHNITKNKQKKIRKKQITVLQTA